jgi:hypothetical protein
MVWSNRGDGWPKFTRLSGGATLKVGKVRVSLLVIVNYC